MTSCITICDTCKTEQWTEGQPTDGERLADRVEKIAQGDAPEQALIVRRHSCVMSCKRACAVTVQAEGKIAYSLGDFAGDETDAEAIIAWAKLHAQSSTGQVPYRSWPEGVKGRFIARHMPLPK